MTLGEMDPGEELASKQSTHEMTGLTGEFREELTAGMTICTVPLRLGFDLFGALTHHIAGVRLVGFDTARGHDLP